jgi:predicted 3-demethylubiquinone-9 3-methyltransferase (glyoxalase superfamily)
LRFIKMRTRRTQRDELSWRVGSLHHTTIKTQAEFGVRFCKNYSPVTEPHSPTPPKQPMSKVTPFLSFNGHAEEAARFYVSLLPDSRIDRVMRSPVDTPSGAAGTVLLVEFTLAGNSFFALNTPGFVFTEAVSFMIACKDQDETDRLWSALTANGGKEVACGWLRDRWGVSWQVTPTRLMELINDPNPDRACRAMVAMMNMIKIDIAAVERAADGP